MGCSAAETFWICVICGSARGGQGRDGKPEARKASCSRVDPRATLPVFLLILCAGCATPSDEPAPTSEPTPAPKLLEFRSPIDLGSKARPGAVGTSCQDSAADGDCGLGEPQVEVDAVGTIYVSGVCCLTVPPPVYVSRDGGATFTELSSNGAREAFGIEGDFAIDDDGTMYFADIEFAATFQVTVWDKDGNFIHHTKWPAPPLVDRDWIRADRSGHLYYVYNTGSATNTYTSTDGGRTWSPMYVHQTPWGLGMAVSGPTDGSLWILGDGRADYTNDGGATWTLEDTSAPGGGNFPVGAFDDGGNLYVASVTDGTVNVARRTPVGEWLQPVNVSGPGSHRMPWMAAGRDGAAVVAWYGANETDSSNHYLHVGVTRDWGATWTWQIADSEAVLSGPFGRDLLDFFQVELGPDGAVHIAYSKLPPGEGNEEQLTYVRSEPDPDLASRAYKNGPNA